MNSRSLTVALALSLLLNVFLVGGAAGAAWHWWRTEPGGERTAERSGERPATQSPPPSTPAAPGAQPPRGLRFAADALPPEQRQQFRRGLRDARRESADLVEAARDGRADVARLLAAPQFDRAAVDAALARTRDADLALRSRVETQVAAFAATLSPEARVTFVDGLVTRGPLRQPPTPARP